MKDQFGFLFKHISKRRLLNFLCLFILKILKIYRKVERILQRGQVPYITYPAIPYVNTPNHGTYVKTKNEHRYNIITTDFI